MLFQPAPPHLSDAVAQKTELTGKDSRNPIHRLHEMAASNKAGQNSGIVYG